jgi:hypothetical protein
MRNRLRTALKGVACAAVVCIIVAASGIAQAKAKVLQKPDGSYDFKAVNKIVVDPMTSYNVDYGKVSQDRMPKIRAILEKTKKNLRKHMVAGAKQAKTNIRFYYKAPNKKSTTLILKCNFDKFDNGNMAMRNLPFGGAAKVEMTCDFINAQNKAVVAKVKGKAKAKGGFAPGGADSEVLWSATNQANGQIYAYLKKLTGLTYDFWSGVKGGAKMGVDSQVDVMKEEKKEYKKKK